MAISKNKILLIVVALILIGVLSISLSLSRQQTRITSKAAPVINIPLKNKYKTESGKPPQFVLLSFDGSLSLDMWQQTTDFVQKMSKEGKPLNFTYFISGVYFLAPQYASLYHPPQAAPGTSLIHFSDSRDSIPKRIEALNRAYLQGNEIASHVNGHFRGFPWSEANWSQEFDEFNKLIFGWKENNQFKDLNTKLVFGPEEVVGFRAPQLSRNDNLFKVEAKDHYLYDSSEQATSSAVWPFRDKNGVWHISLSAIPIMDTKFQSIAMDYNFYSFQTGAQDRLKKGTPAWEKAYKQVYDSYLNYFATNYKTTRAPVLIGHHFSLWNDGLYWSVMQDVAKEVCGQPEVHCTTFKELVNYLNPK